MSSKKCPECGAVKDFSEFYKNRSRKDGITVYCKACIKVKSHIYHALNKEKARERLNRWRANNREYVRQRDKVYREENPEIEFNKQKRYRENHKDELYLKGKKYRDEHPDYFKGKNKERRVTKRLTGDGTITSESKQAIFDKQHGKCIYCGCDLNDSTKHLDHIIPLSRGGTHTIDNIQWTCKSCNLSKGDKLECEWGTYSYNVDRSRIPKELCEHIVKICEE